MNKYVIEELKKCKVAQLPPYDNTTRQLVIPKACNVDQYLQPGKCFLIKLEPYILNPPEGFTLHDNWNQGRKPPQQFMKAEISQVMGKMVKITGLGYDYTNQMDTNQIWEGWLPKKSIEIIGDI